MDMLNKANYEKLHDYAIANLTDDKVDMGEYVGGDIDDDIDYPKHAIKLVNCGSVACMLGHSTVIFQEEARRADSWNEFSHLVFGCQHIDEEWHFIFSPDWANWDNTVKGACRRIELLLEKGKPTWWAYNSPEADWEW